MPVKNSLLPWQQNNWELLYTYIKQKRVPHALLITGSNGLGKHNLVQQFAHSLLCSKPTDKGLNCGACRSCQLIKSNTHPDLIYIKPEEEKTTISINQIRTIVTDTYLKPQFDGYRLVVITPADSMTASASNAFLKCLEEPGERTIFVLITTKPNKLPATIISRCQKISVMCPEKKMLYDWLQGQGIEENQETLLNLINSSILTAQHISDKAILKQRTDCFKDWMAITKFTTYPAIVSEKWQKYPQAEVINWLISWVTDLIKCVHTKNCAQICNQDFAESLQEASQQLNLRSLYAYYDRLLASRQQIDTQTNFQIMIEENLVQWQTLNWRNSL